jgi:Secretion system C-terminal sorting domain
MLLFQTDILLLQKMKKILATAALLGFANILLAQLSFGTKNLTVTTARGVTIKPVIKVYNTSNKDVTFDFYVNQSGVKLPTGYAPQSVCVLPGLCYNWDANIFIITGTKNISLGPFDSVIVEPGINISATARTDSSAIIPVVIAQGTSSDTITFTINAHSWATAISNVDQNEAFAVQPTIANSNITITNAHLFTKISIVDVAGKAITAKVFGNSVDVSSLSNGIYYALAFDKNNATRKAKFVVNR